MSFIHVVEHYTFPSPILRLCGEEVGDKEKDDSGVDLSSWLIDVAVLWLHSARIYL
jgi:hypothetical protein